MGNSWECFPPETGPAIDAEFLGHASRAELLELEIIRGWRSVRRISGAEKSPFVFDVDATLSAIMIDLDRVP